MFVCLCVVQATMEDPLHYGKLDHPGKRVTTLPASSAGEYGKLDRVSQTCVQGKVVCVLWGRCVCCVTCVAVSG